MAKDRNDLIQGNVLPQSALDALQEFIGTLSSNVFLVLSSATAVQVPAAAGSLQVGIGVGGLWRYISASASATHPGGAAGTYDVLAVASANVFGVGDVDTTDYAFGLQVVATGGPATGNFNGRAITQWRKIGEVVWSGSAITRVRQILPTSSLGTVHALAPIAGGVVFTGRTAAGVERIRINDDGSIDLADATGVYATVGLQWAAGPKLQVKGALDILGTLTVAGAAVLPPASSVTSAMIVDGTIVAGDINAALKPSGSAAAGTEALRALGATGSTAAAGNDARLSDDRTPSDDSVTAAKVNAALKPSTGAAAGTEALRALGATAATAAAGNDARLSDTRTPTDNTVTAAKVNTALKPSSGAAAGTEALRALGATASTAAAGNDARLSDTRTPTDNTVTTVKLAANAVTAAKIEVQQAWQTVALTGFMPGEVLSYFKDSLGIVHFKGVLQLVSGGGPIAANAIMTNLPAGYRPAVTIFIPLMRLDVVGVTWAALSGAGVLTNSSSALPASANISFGPVAFLAEN